MVSSALLLFALGCSVSAAQIKLVIYPEEKSITLKKNENLTLTCSVLGDASNKSYDLSWKHHTKGRIDSSYYNSFGRYSISRSNNVLVIAIYKLQITDAGFYVCELRDRNVVLKQKISVTVNSERDKCSPKFFDCGRLLCVPRHYLCDGFPDCPDSSDESFQLCGHDACEGKFFCDGRCVPKKYCCNPAIDVNCSAGYLIPCCEKFINDLFPIDILKMESSESPVQYKFHNLGFYQSTVYTMISCAIAFIFMSTIMLIAVCRIRMRHNAWFMPSRSSHRHRFWQRPPAPAQNRCVNATTTARLPPHVQRQGNRSETVDPLENFVLLTFDGNTGFELAEYGPKPPPYAETNMGIPPPPYSSRLDISTEATDIGMEGGRPHLSSTQQQ